MTDALLQKALRAAEIGPNALTAAREADPVQRQKSLDECVFRAIAMGSVVDLDQALDRGGSPDAVTAQRHSALQLVCAASSLGMCTSLLKHKANPNFLPEQTKQPTPLGIAAARASAELVVTLMDHGAHLGAADHAGRTPLIQALKRGIAHSSGLILDHHARNPAGSDPALNARDQEGNGALHYLVENFAFDSPNASARFESVTLLERLLGAGADANLPGAHGITPAMIACRRLQGDALGRLLVHRADLDRRDEKGWSAVDHLKAAIQAAPDQPLNDLFSQVLRRDSTMGILAEIEALQPTIGPASGR